MKIGGLQKLTLVDYPGKIVATVFLIGCNFKCGFCHNPELIDSRSNSIISEKEFFDFLKQRKGLLDGVCITGGEPTLSSGLLDFVKKIKGLGFLVKLDTNGSNPEILKELINSLDYIAMDIKTSSEKYDKAVNVKVNLDNINKSIDLIKNSNVDYEFRTTVIPGLVDKNDFVDIGEWLKGVKKFVLQQFRNKKVLDKKFEKIRPYSDEDFYKFKKILEKYVGNVELRL